MAESPSHEYARLMECPICMEAVTNHRCLPCQHIFCEHCLEPIVNGRTITCPVCREECHMKGPSVSSFPRNLVLVNLLEKMCEKCKYRNKEINCPHCSKWLCQDCHKLCKVQLQEQKSAVREEIQGLLSSGNSVLEQIQKSTIEVHKQTSTAMQRIDENTDKIIDAIKLRQKELKDQLRREASYERDRLGALYNDVDLDMSTLEGVLTSMKATKDEACDDLAAFQKQCTKWKDEMENAKAKRSMTVPAKIEFQSRNEHDQKITLGDISIKKPGAN